MFNRASVFISRRSVNQKLHTRSYTSSGAYIARHCPFALTSELPPLLPFPDLHRKRRRMRDRPSFGVIRAQLLRQHARDAKPAGQGEPSDGGRGLVAPK